jgi:hypothetical protein
MTEPMNDMTLIDRGPDIAERRDVPGTDGLWALRSYWDASPEERARPAVADGAAAARGPALRAAGPRVRLQGVLRQGLSAGADA